MNDEQQLINTNTNDDYFKLKYNSYDNSYKSC